MNASKNDQISGCYIFKVISVIHFRVDGLRFTFLKKYKGIGTKHQPCLKIDIIIATVGGLPD